MFIVTKKINVQIYANYMAEDSTGIVLGILVVGFIVLGGLVAYTYYKPSESITNIQGAATDINAKVAQLAATINQINSTTGTINKLLLDMADSNKKYMDSNNAAIAALGKQISDMSSATVSKTDLSAAVVALGKQISDLNAANKADLSAATTKIDGLNVMLSNIVSDSKTFFENNAKSNVELKDLINSIKSMVFTKDDLANVTSRLNDKLVQLSAQPAIVGYFTQGDDHVEYIAYAVTGIHAKMLIAAQQYFIKLSDISEYLDKVIQEKGADQRAILVKARVDVMIDYLKRYIRKLSKMPQVI
jgi:hypothetical protein